MANPNSVLQMQPGWVTPAQLKALMDKRSAEDPEFARKVGEQNRRFGGRFGDWTTWHPDMKKELFDALGVTAVVMPLNHWDVLASDCEELVVVGGPNVRRADVSSAQSMDQMLKEVDAHVEAVSDVQRRWMGDGDKATAIERSRTKLRRRLEEIRTADAQRSGAPDLSALQRLRPASVGMQQAADGPYVRLSDVYALLERASRPGE